MRSPHFKPLSPLGLGLSLGLIWAIASLLGGWFAMFGWCKGFVEILSSIYIGYGPSFIGGIIGALWGFVAGFIQGAVLGYFYNLFTQRYSSKD